LSYASRLTTQNFKTHMHLTKEKSSTIFSIERTVDFNFNKIICQYKFFYFFIITDRYAQQILSKLSVGIF